LAPSILAPGTKKRPSFQGDLFDFVNVIVRDPFVNGQRKSQGFRIAVVNGDSNPLSLGNREQFSVDRTERAIFEDGVNRVLHFEFSPDFQSCERCHSKIVPQGIDICQIGD
jgi:hypothetical protein